VSYIILVGGFFGKCLNARAADKEAMNVVVEMTDPMVYGLGGLDV
jgi:hypothetical protein